MYAHFILLTSQRIIWIPLAEAINAQHSLKKKGIVASSFFFTDAVATTLDSRQTLLYVPKKPKVSNKRVCHILIR